MAVKIKVQRNKIIVGAALAVAAAALVGMGLWFMRADLHKVWNKVTGTPQPPMDMAVPRSRFPVKGIDVSHHNGDIDFRAVAADSVEFVLIKATEGIDHIDSCMVRNYDRAVEAGLKVGFYHFFRFDRGGVRQGRHFLSAVSGRPVDLPLVIDVETANNPKTDYYRVVGRLRDMIGFLRRKGLRVMIYCNGKTYDTYIRGNFDDAELWLASESVPGAKGDRRELWQHSHAGRVRGIPTPVDVNTFNGSREEFRKWLESIPVQKPVRRRRAVADTAAVSAPADSLRALPAQGAPADSAAQQPAAPAAPAAPAPAPPAAPENHPEKAANTQ